MAAVAARRSARKGAASRAWRGRGLGIGPGPGLGLGLGLGIGPGLGLGIELGIRWVTCQPSVARAKALSRSSSKEKCVLASNASSRAAACRSAASSAASSPSSSSSRGGASSSAMRASSTSISPSRSSSVSSPRSACVHWHRAQWAAEAAAASGSPHGGRVAHRTERSGSSRGEEWLTGAHAGRPGLAAFHWARWRGGPTARTPPWVARRGGSRDAGRIAPPDGPRAAPVPGGRGGPALAGYRNGALLSARSAASPSASRANMKVRSPKRSKGTYTAAAVSAVAGAPRGVEPGGRPSDGRAAAVAPGIGPNSQNFRVPRSLGAARPSFMRPE